MQMYVRVFAGIVLLALVLTKVTLSIGWSLNAFIYGLMIGGTLLLVALVLDHTQKSKQQDADKIDLTAAGPNPVNKKA